MRWRNHEEKIGVPVEKGSAKVADLARPVLVSQFGKHKAAEILDAMRTYDARSQAEIPRFKSRVNRTMLGIAVETLPLYQALLQVSPQDEALNVIRATIPAWMDAQFALWGTRKVYRSRGLMRCLRRLMAWEVNRADDPDGWYYEMLHMELGR